jgi:hypothetical protein
MATISPICKKCKNFISALKSPTYRDFMIKKLLKSKTSKSHTWAVLRYQRTKMLGLSGPCKKILEINVYKCGVWR